MGTRSSGLLRLTQQTMLQLALAAMVVRALVPAGWMPGPSEGATGAPLIICTGQGLATVYLDAAGKPIPHHDQGQTHQRDVCPYAAAGHLALPEIGPHYAAPSLALLKEPAAGKTDALPRAHALRAHRPRGPPSLV